MDVGPQVLADRYELVSPLARGGMGQVYRARDRLLNRAVAVKILRSEFTDDPGFRARFRAEAQHAAMIVHPHIASVFDYGEVPAAGSGEPLAYLVMELVDGESLAHLLRREPRLSPQLTLSILRQTAAALAAAHAVGIVHRDVKPGNVLVAPDGTVKITDFGVAWSASSVPLTGTGQVIGTAHYLSPEQAQGAKATPASDVYALGAVAYECLAGRRIFEGENSVQIALRQIRDEPDPLPPDVPADLRALVGRALAKDPAVRYADGAQLQAAADRVDLAPRTTSPTGTAVLPLPLGVAAAGAATPGPGTAVTSRIAGPGEPPARPDRRRAALWVAVGAALTVLAVVLGLNALSGGGTAADDAPATTSSSAPPSSSPPSSPSATTPAPPTTVTVAVDGLVGRPVQEVRAELVGEGLTVQLAPVETAGVPEGQVTAVAPAGAVPIGSTVTVSYAVAPPPAPAPPQENGGGEGNGDEGGGNGGEGDGNQGNQGGGNGDGDKKGKDKEKGED